MSQRTISTSCTIVQSTADDSLVVAIVSADRLAAVELPEPRHVVRAGGHEVRRIGAEGCIPYPTLVARQGLGEGEGVARGRPNLDGAVGRRGCQVSASMCRTAAFGQQVDSSD